MWCFGLINSGLVPRTLCPMTKPLKLLQLLSKTNTTTASGKFKKPVLCATCSPDPLSPYSDQSDEAELVKLGLRPKSLYAITGYKMHKGKHILRMMGYKAE